MKAGFAALVTMLLVLGSRSAQAQWAAAPDAPLASAAPRTQTTPNGGPLRAPLVPNGTDWTARVYNCERPADAPFSEDPGCGMLVLRSRRDSRFLLLDGDYLVNEPRMSLVKQPGGRKGLLVVDARGLSAHADVWMVHLIEDDGRGPRLLMRSIIDACSWGDDGAKCTSVRPVARYLDADADGDLDLELSFQGGNGVRRRDLFVRQPNGRFTLPARYLTADSFIAEMHKLAPPLGVEAPSAPAPVCTWSVKAPRTALKAHRQQARQGPVVGTLENGAKVELAEVRGSWSRLNVPLAGWVPSSGLVESCTP